MNDWVALGRKIRIHPLFWLVAAASIAIAQFQELLILFAIVMVHEMGHATAAHFFSWRIRKIVILPFGGVAETDEHGNRPLKEELIVTIAGPFQHVWIGLCAYLLHQAQVLPPGLYGQIMEANLTVLLFNLIPVWPLDGGKIMNLAFSMYLPFLKAFRLTVYSSLAALLVFHCTALWLTPANLSIWAVVLYLYVSLWKEWKQLYFVFMRFLLERYYGKGDPLRYLKTLQVEGNAYLYEVLENFKRGCKHPLIVLQNGIEIGQLDENELLHAYFSEKQTHAKVKDIMYSY
ncbi:M50 family metallopeptidase [Heyndrickxia acidiproducens]|uniref:M50 family metallopeptidase n=1 Tax=Heyndrickxia acidiproducens TaxID=1121084 RepID=UPI00037F9786|nr:M50 family metallopeptidase [Heyndrickxia acidiproducens]